MFEQVQEPVKEGLNRSEVFSHLSDSFQHVEREAMVYLLIETMHRNSIRLSESFTTSQIDSALTALAQEKKLHFMLMLATEQCVEEFFMMIDEGMIKKHNHKKKLHSLSIVPGTKLAEVVGKFIAQ